MRPKSLLLKCCLGTLLVTSAIISCKKDNPSEKITSGYGNVSYFAKASGSHIKTASVKSDTLGGQVSVGWSSASVYVEKIAFVGKSDSLLDTTITIEKKLDIFSADALAGVIKLPAGSYRDVKIKMYFKKSRRSEMAFDFKGTFTNTEGGKDSVMVGSSYPFEANLNVTEIAIDPSGKYNVVFSFDLNRVLTGITTAALQTARSYTWPDHKKTYVIWKGGSADEPFYDQVIQNWQTVVNVVVSKEE